MEKAIEFIVVASPFVLAVVAGLVAALAAIAPLTKSKSDDKALELLRKLQLAISWLMIKITPSGARAALVDEVKRVEATKAPAKK